MTKIKHSNLPHIDMKDHYQFVTFRTKDSIDGYIQKLYGSNDSEKIKQSLTEYNLVPEEWGGHVNYALFVHTYNTLVPPEVAAADRSKIRAVDISMTVEMPAGRAGMVERTYATKIRCRNLSID